MGRNQSPCGAMCKELDAEFLGAGSLPVGRVPSEVTVKLQRTSSWKESWREARLP